MKSNRVSTSAHGSTALTLENYVPYQLALLSSRLSHGLEAVCLRECGISRNDWRVLALIAQYDGCPSIDLVDRQVMDAVAVHRAVRRLESAGLVKAGQAEADRRMRLLKVTPTGRKVYETLVPYALELERRLLSVLGAVDAQHFGEMLSKMLATPMEPPFV